MVTRTRRKRRILASSLVGEDDFVQATLGSQKLKVASVLLGTVIYSRKHAFITCVVCYTIFVCVWSLCVPRHRRMSDARELL